MKIKDPLIIVFEDQGNVQTHLYRGERSYKQYGILIADIVRHVPTPSKSMRTTFGNGSIRNAIIRRVLRLKSSRTD